MIARILVPLDFLLAHHPALQAAQQYFPQAELSLLHVAATPERQTQAEQEMAQLGLGEVVTASQAAPEILSRVAQGHHDLILMGTSGKARRGLFSVGSVAQQVVRGSPVPVLTVRMNGELPRAEELTEPRVLVLYDFSANAARALNFVREKFPASQVSLLHIVGAQQSEAQRQAAREELLRLGGGRVVQGEPGEMALTQARSGSYDLLVLGTSAKGRLDQLLFGSVARKLVSESPIPVLTVGGE